MAEKKKRTTTEKEIEKVVESPENLTKKEIKTDTTSVSIINTKELNSLIEEDLENDKVALKPKKHPFIHFMLILLLLVSLGVFFIQDSL